MYFSLIVLGFSLVAFDLLGIWPSCHFLGADLQMAFLVWVHWYVALLVRRDHLARFLFEGRDLDLEWGFG